MWTLQGTRERFGLLLAHDFSENRFALFRIML